MKGGGNVLTNSKKKDMITVEQLYQGTHEGLDIILMIYPQARAAAENPKLKFKVRRDERTPSAALWRTQTRAGTPVWKVVDYGDDGHAASPLDLYMRERGVRRPGEALVQLAEYFNIEGLRISPEVNRARWEERAAGETEQEGELAFELLEEIPEAWLPVLGPRVTRETTAALGWYGARYVGWVKNRRVKCEFSTEHYPILMRECVVPAENGEAGRTFYKIYKPLAMDKAWRFAYAPRGAKPRRYVNGLKELREAYEKYNSGDKREEKLGEAVICSGERDALCCRSLGYYPIWFNSETYEVSEGEIREIEKLVERIYNIPDIDQTGRRKGRELALRFPQIYTVWLPEWLAGYKDHRGRGRKDLRDWMELRGTLGDFEDLLRRAAPAKFWRARTGGARVEYSIDSVALLNFLELNGFHCLRDETSDSTRFVRIRGTMVEEVRGRDIRRFLREWSEERALDGEVRNLILNSQRIATPAMMENLSEVCPDFMNNTAHSQIFYFRKNEHTTQAVEITGDGITVKEDGEETGHYVWQDNVIAHRFERLPDMFSISRTVRPDGEGAGFDIEIHDLRSPLLCYVINTSRVHWRREMETRFDSKEERAAYAAAHPFDIAGEGLTEREIRDQKENLLNKIFSIGYILHRYKDPARAWAPQALDNKIGSGDECNGRSGKSFLFKAFEHFMRQVKLSGRNPKLMDNPHVFDQVDMSTDFILVDDCAQYLSMSTFYDIVTGSLTVNPKNNRSFTIPFDRAPKLGFTTNYIPSDFDASTMARLLPMVFSDYYHQRAVENDYLEDRSIRDDFGRNLLTEEYPESDWNADINFFMQCCRFYLSVVNEGIKLLPPMDNILRRKNKAEMGENFEDWAGVYFSPEAGRLDQLLVRRDAFNDFVNEVGNVGSRYSMKRFTKQLEAFCKESGDVACLNPEALCNNRHRILRSRAGRTEDMIYLRSVAAELEGRPLNDPTASNLPF